MGLAVLTAVRPIFTSTTNPAALRVQPTLMAATRKTATPPPLLPLLEAGTASTGDEASVHNNRYEHKHKLNTVYVSGQEKAKRGKKKSLHFSGRYIVKKSEKIQILSKFPHHNLKSIRNLTHKYIL